MSTANKIRESLDPSPKYWKRGGVEYVGPAPSLVRSGSDSASFSVTFEGDEYGAWKDFKTGEGGSLYSLAALLHIATPKRTSPIETDSPKSLSEYEANKGLPADYLYEKGWREGTHGKLDRACLFIPLEDDTRQVRYLDGGSPKFTWETSRPEETDGGKALAFYGTRQAKQLAQKNQCNFMVWTNGAPSVEALQFYGVPAFALVGGENNLARKVYVDRVLKGFSGSILIALDCDTAGRTGSEKLLNLLGERGLIIDLGGNDKFDGADFARLWKGASLERLRQLAKEKDDSRPPRTAHEAADAVLAQVRGERPMRGRPMETPFTLFHQFGGMARYMLPDLVTGVVALSGHGKTSWWHSLVKMLLRQSRKWGVMADSREFTPELDHIRRSQDYTNINFDDIISHLIATQEQAEDIDPHARKGQALSLDSIQELAMAYELMKMDWSGQMEFSEEYPFIEDTLDYMKRRTLEIRDSGGNMDLWVFDYLHLYRCRPQTLEGTGEHIYNVILQEIKQAARSVHAHALVMLQPNKSPTEEAITRNVRLKATDIGAANPNHFNCIIGLNVLYGRKAVWEHHDNASSGAWTVFGYDPATNKPLIDKARLKTGEFACVAEVLKNTGGSLGMVNLRGDFEKLQWLNQSWHSGDLRLPLGED